MECAFGGIDRRWGIFSLEGSLQNHQYTIDAALRMHNCIVEFRELQKNEGKMNVDDDLEELNIEWDNFVMNTHAQFSVQLLRKQNLDHVASEEGPQLLKQKRE